MTKRLTDFALALILFVILLVPLLFIALLVRLTSKGPAVHWSKRIGRNNEIYLMPKFRTMRIETPQVATHKLQNADNYLTPIGAFLRKTSIDELPQLWSVIAGQMSLVGPRPALFNQYDLMQLRTEKNVHLLKPGITGWAQINGRDELPIPVKVEMDEYYLKKQSLLLDLKILFLTVHKVSKSEGIKH